MNIRGAVKVFLVLVVGLPILQLILVWVQGLLGAMGDENAAMVLGHFGTATRILWLVCLVGLVVLVAIHSLDSREE